MKGERERESQTDRQTDKLLTQRLRMSGRGEVGERMSERGSDREESEIKIYQMGKKKDQLTLLNLVRCQTTHTHTHTPGWPQ